MKNVRETETSYINVNCFLKYKKIQFCFPTEQWVWCVKGAFSSAHFLLLQNISINDDKEQNKNIINNNQKDSKLVRIVNMLNKQTEIVHYIDSVL